MESLLVSYGRDLASLSWPTWTVVTIDGLLIDGSGVVWLILSLIWFSFNKCQCQGHIHMGERRHGILPQVLWWSIVSCIHFLLHFPEKSDPSTGNPTISTSNFFIIALDLLLPRNLNTHDQTSSLSPNSFLLKKEKKGKENREDNKSFLNALHPLPNPSHGPRVFPDSLFSSPWLPSEKNVVPDGWEARVWLGVYVPVLTAGDDLTATDFHSLLFNRKLALLRVGPGMVTQCSQQPTRSLECLA